MSDSWITSEHMMGPPLSARIYPMIGVPDYELYMREYRSWKSEIVGLESSLECVERLLKDYKAKVAQFEAEVEATNAALEINDNCISGVEDALEKCEAENERLRKIINKYRLGIMKVDDGKEINLEALGGES